MSGCPTHGTLVGGYVLGALEPGEMEEMRAHVAACPQCGPEADRLVALAIALAVLLPLGGDEGESAYARVRLAGPADAAASASLAEVPAGTRIRLRTRGLPTGAEYELWCVRADGRWVSGGTFRADRDGRVEAELTAAVNPGDYHRMVVTRRPEGDGGAERGEAVLDGELRY